MAELELRERSPRGYPAERRRVVGLADALIDWSNCALESGKRLSQNAKLTYELIAGFPDAWFSVSWLAARLDRALSTARAALAELELGGWIRREQRFDRQTGGQRSNRYVILRRPGEVVHAAAGAAEAPVQRKEDYADPKEECQSAQAELEAGADLQDVSDTRHAIERTDEDLDVLRGCLSDARAGHNEEAKRVAETLPAVVSSPTPALERACLTLETLQELVNVFGTERVTQLERELATERWRVPGVAEAACRLLLERRKKSAIKHPRHYVSTLYANALERAQGGDLPLRPGPRACPGPRGGPDDSLDELYKYKDELHARIATLAQQFGTGNERARAQEEMVRVCRRILHREREMRRSAS